MQNHELIPQRPPAAQGFGSFKIFSSPAARWILFAGLALLALAVRLPKLGERPMHTDEAVNGYITGELLAGESYHYDPQDRHGPVLYLFAEPISRLCGAKSFAQLTETELRLTPVIAGSVTVLLFGAAVDIFGFTACFVAALLFAMAPLPVYYSRYFIHETIFVAVTLGLAICGWRALTKSSIWAAAGAGLLAAFLVACKETFIIHFFALGLAVVIGGWFIRPRGKWPSFKIAAVALAVFLVTAILLFTWFGRNWRGLADLFRAAPHLAARAYGEGHQKSFGYYFGLVDPTFIFFLLAAVGIFAGIRDAVTGLGKIGVLLTVYAVTVFLIYSGIPYKTPWLALNLWLPLALLCGFGVERVWMLVRRTPIRWIAVIAGGVFRAIVGRETVALAFQNPADQKNPLAYAHTVDDVLRLAPRLERVASERGVTQPTVAVVAADPWPLPWYLRKFQRVGFWQPGQDPGRADFYITSADSAGLLGDKLNDCRPEFFGVRPEVIVILWVPEKSTP